MAAPKKNQFWKLRSSHGREKIFQTPDLLEVACYQYFTAVESHPLKEHKVLSSGKRVTLDKMRPFTLKGLFIFLDINKQTWENYKQREDFLAIIERVESIIYTQKFEGAAAGLLKESIISRELGLADKEKEFLENLTEEQLDRIIQKILLNSNK